MIKTTLIVNYRYRFEQYYIQGFAQMWIVTHDGTPVGFQSAMIATLENFAEHLKTQIPAVSIEFDQDNRSILFDGKPGVFEYFEVVRQFDEEDDISEIIRQFDW